MTRHDQMSIESLHEALSLKRTTKNTMFASFQAYQSRDEAQAMIARVLAEKDTLRCQLVELQERVFSLQATGGSRERQQSCDVISHTDLNT